LTWYLIRGNSSALTTGILRGSAFMVLILIATFIPALSQGPRATIRVEVKTGSGPAVAAKVTLNDISVPTDKHGIAVASFPVGNVDVVG
jgi:hypothetical protein